MKLGAWLIGVRDLWEFLKIKFSNYKFQLHWGWRWWLISITMDWWRELVFLGEKKEKGEHGFTWCREFIILLCGLD
jgi:hypothetical protein